MLLLLLRNIAQILETATDYESPMVADTVSTDYKADVRQGL